jgi:hypothetical protein
MKNVFNNRRGFTLLEIILAFVAMTVIAVVAGVGLVEITKGYVFSKKNAFVAQQGQIALARLKKELSNITSINLATATSITFLRLDPSTGSSISHTISWAGGSNPLLLDGDTLVTPVASFNLSFYNFYSSANSSYSSTTSMIEMTLKLNGAENAVISFTDRVNL